MVSTAGEELADGNGRSGAVLTSRHRNVVVLTLNRPNVHNALDEPMLETLHREMMSAGQDPAIRAVVLTGAGESFCSGDDLRTVAGADSAEFSRSLQALQRVTETVVSLDKPVIGALNGPAYGAGLELTLAFDARLAVPSFVCAAPEVRLGLVATNGASLLLPMLVGPSKARRLLLSGTPVDAEWCVGAGLVDELVDPGQLLDRAAAVAEEMSSGGPHAVAATRRLLNERLGESLQAALTSEASTCVAARATAEAREGLDAFFARREPVWLT